MAYPYFVANSTWSLVKSVIHFGPRAESYVQLVQSRYSKYWRTSLNI